MLRSGRGLRKNVFNQLSKKSKKDWISIYEKNIKDKISIMADFMAEHMQ